MGCKPGEQNYNFISYERGHNIAGVRIVERAPNDLNGARWRVRCAREHEFIVRGIVLRERERHARTVRCWHCKPKHRRIGS